MCRQYNDILALDNLLLSIFTSVYDTQDAYNWRDDTVWQFQVDPTGTGITLTSQVYNWSVE